jgi:hypothetical protein
MGRETSERALDMLAKTMHTTALVASAIPADLRRSTWPGKWRLLRQDPYRHDLRRRLPMSFRKAQAATIEAMDVAILDGMKPASMQKVYQAMREERVEELRLIRRRGDGHGYGDGSGNGHGDGRGFA